MVERICRVWCLSDGNDPDAPDVVGKPWWRLYAPRVREHIAAMREPTADMIAALTQKREAHNLVVGVRWETATVVDIWQAGIDEALK